MNKYLERLKSEKRSFCEQSKLPNPPSDSFGSDHSRCVSKNIQGELTLLTRAVVTIATPYGNIQLCDDLDEVARLTRAGEVVFTSEEVAELEKNPDAIPIAFEIKRTFTGAEVARMFSESIPSKSSLH